MNLSELKKVHIIGIGGSASSAIANLLVNNSVSVTGSEMKQRDDLHDIEAMGVKIFYQHSSENITDTMPDRILYSPAVPVLDPGNPELKKAEELGIKSESWQTFLGRYLVDIGYKGIMVSGSEGKGTTGSILAAILKDSVIDPLVILGAKMKYHDSNEHSNIYIGKGKFFLMEADEYNRNFHNYHPSINLMINFQYEHPECYRDFEEYKKAFLTFYKGMHREKKLIFRASESIVDFVSEHNLESRHDIVWFGNREEIDSLPSGSKFYTISNDRVDFTGNNFRLSGDFCDTDFCIPALPGYIKYNAAASIIAALELGLSVDQVKSGLSSYRGLVRRFDIYKGDGNSIFITDYGHSPSAVSLIINEIKKIFPGKKVHLIFQPHLFSRTFNFFDSFIDSLSMADKVSLVDIFPAREREEDWSKKVSTDMLYQALKQKNIVVNRLGESKDIFENVIRYISCDEITCFMGAGDMDRYYGKVLDCYRAVDYFN